MMEFTLKEPILDVFNNTFVFFGTLTHDGYVINLNGRIFERTTTEPGLLIGQKFSETVYWQASEETPFILEKAITQSLEGIISKTILDFRVNSQERITIELFLHPLKNSSDESNLIFFFAQDVTERENEIKQFRQTNELILDATDKAEIGLWSWDFSKETMFTTTKFRELFELSQNEELSLKSFIKNAHPEDIEQVEKAFRDSQVKGSEINIEYRIVYANEQINWIFVRGNTSFDERGTAQNIKGIVRKISDKEIDNEELSIVYAREKKARDEAVEANRAKDFFLAVVSHELRSPLNAILGWSKILLTNEVDQETTRNALETIEKSARSQAKLIEDLIDSARVSSGKLKLEFRPVNVYEIVKTVCNLQQSIAEAKKVNLQFTSDRENISVYGDSARLQQVFNNLLSNALKFTDEGKSINVYIETGSEAVQIFIADNGQGISADLLPNIFNQFRQGDESTTIDRSGLGLGLSIVKILVEKHQGTVSVESKGLGFGSVFTVTLPLCGVKGDPNSEVKESAAHEEKSLDKVKILIVEDDPDSREVLQLLLEQCGAAVESADSADKAMRLLTNFQAGLPNIIVSDLAMPDEDGFSLLSRIRQLPAEKGGKIPALALSAFASNENKRRAFDVGFDKYHTKPFEPDEIIQDILQLLQNNHR